MHRLLFVISMMKFVVHTPSLVNDVILTIVLFRHGHEPIHICVMRRSE